MKKKILPGAIWVLLLFSCEEIDDLLTFYFTDQTAIRIESAMPLNLPLQIATPAVTSSSRQAFENNNTHADLVKDVKLQQLKLTITHPDTKTFSFVKTIRIFISASGHSEIELASLDNISTTTGVIELVPTDQKLDPYVKAPSYDLRTEVTTDETLAEDVDILVDLKFRVTADTF